MSNHTDYLQNPKSRLNYRQGMMLDAEDFSFEQTYHRRQLSLVLRHLGGHGTIAGLEVTVSPAQANDLSEQIRVSPGVAVDRLGRVIEVTATQTLRLSKWMDYRIRNHPARLAPLVNGTNRTLLADLFLLFGEVGAGLRPAFPEGVVNATDAAVPAHTVESFALVLEPRPCADPANEPASPWDPPPSPTDRASVLRSIYGAYQEQLGKTGYPDKFDTEDADLSAVFLGRLRVPLLPSPDASFKRAPGSAVTVDDSRRPFLPGGLLLGSLLPQA